MLIQQFLIVLIGTLSQSLIAVVLLALSSPLLV